MQLRILLWLVSSLISVQIFAQVKQEIVPNPAKPNHKVTVSLPFQLREIEDDADVLFVQQGAVGLLKPNSKQKYLMTGPLCPCIGAIFHNTENGYILLFHKHYTNAIDSFE